MKSALFVAIAIDEKPLSNISAFALQRVQWDTDESLESSITSLDRALLSTFFAEFGWAKGILIWLLRIHLTLTSQGRQRPLRSPLIEPC